MVGGYILILSFFYLSKYCIAMKLIKNYKIVTLLKSLSNCEFSAFNFLIYEYFLLCLLFIIKSATLQLKMIQEI